MPSRYRITLESASEDADYEKAAATLEVITGSSRGEVEYWLRNLPHTITSTASETKGRNLMHTFTSLGFAIGSSPDMPPADRKEGGRDYKNLDFNVSAVAKSTGHKGFYLTLLIITVIILSFAASLFFAMKLIQRHANPGLKNVEVLIKKGNYAKAKSVLLKQINKTGGSSSDYLNLAIARITRIRNQGRKTGWRGHLTSITWEDDLKQLKNYFTGTEGTSALQDLNKSVKLNP